MDFNKINRQLANIEDNKKNKFESYLAHGIIQGSILAVNSNYNITLNPSEIFFFAELKAKNLIYEEEIEALSLNYGIKKCRLTDLRSLGVIDWLSQTENEAITAFKDKLLPNKTLEELQKRGWINIFSESEKEFLYAIKDREICINDKLLLGVLRTQYGISQDKWQKWLNSGAIAILTQSEKNWLQAVKEGHKKKTLEQLCQDLELKTTWHLKDRIQVQPDGQRIINYKPIIQNFDLTTSKKSKVNWYSPPTEYFEQIDVVPDLVKSDILLFTKVKSELSFWQRARLSHLEQAAKCNPAAFKQELWNILPPKERASICDLSPNKIKCRKEIKNIFGVGAFPLIENNEYFFLAAVRRNPKADLSILASQYKCNIETLKARGYIDYLTSDEYLLLQNIQQNPNNSIFKNDIISLKKRKFYLEPTQAESAFLKHLAIKKVKSVEELMGVAEMFLISPTQLLGLRAKGFIDFIQENELTNLRNIINQPKCTIPWRFKNRLSEKEGQTLISDQIFISPEPKYRFNAQVKYKENRSILINRINRKTSSIPQLQYKDTALFFTADIATLNYKDAERAIELRASSLKIKDFHIPSNTDLEFLRKISGRKSNYEILRKIAHQDFLLQPSHIDKLEQDGFFKSDGKYIIVTKDEAECLTNARIWLNFPKKNMLWAQRLISKLGIKIPDKEVITALKNKCDPVNIGKKVIDYSIYFKLLRNEPLSNKEKIRLHCMRQNGIHPESPEFIFWIKEEPPSKQMKKARKEAYLLHYEKVYGINRPALEMLNKFKQMSHSQLIQLGMKEEEIKRYHEGIKGAHKIFNKHILPTKTEPIIYYSISHTGPISGRKFLEQSIAKKEIAVRSQKRDDLIFHDLKVVDAVNLVIDERKAQGWKIKEIRNEASQYSAAKTGVANDKRAGGSFFMDAVIIFEEIETQGGGSGKTEAIAVEYGNYPIHRMRLKLENSNFDHAIVYAKKDYTARYQKHISIPNVVFRSI